jgi:hypothetical protein
MYDKTEFQRHYISKNRYLAVANYSTKTTISRSPPDDTYCRASHLKVISVQHIKFPFSYIIPRDGSSHVFPQNTMHDCKGNSKRFENALISNKARIKHNRNDTSTHNPFTLLNYLMYKQWLMCAFVYSNKFDYKCMWPTKITVECFPVVPVIGYYE